MNSCSTTQRSSTSKGGSIRPCAKWAERSDLTTVFFAAPVMRDVAQIESPSANTRIIASHRSVGSLFILTSMLDRSSMVNRNSLTAYCFCGLLSGCETSAKSLESQPRGPGLLRNTSQGVFLSHLDTSIACSTGQSGVSVFLLSFATVFLQGTQ